MDTCQNCGKPLDPAAVHGLCPECLLKAGLDSEAVVDPYGDTQPTPQAEPAAVDPRFRGAPDQAEIARLFPQLEIIELLGQGGMGVVYKARQPQLDRLVALKVLPAGAAQDPTFAERFAREARALAKLNHPNIVTIYDFGQAGELYYLVMEYVDGANLREIERTGQLAPAHALAIIPKICDALQYAHEEGIVHRDIKPENILVDKKGRVKIADFGLAKLLGKAPADYTLTGTHQAMGTPHYMAPEQMEKPLTVDHRADIYSLGVVLYEMLTGELPLGRFQPPSEKVHVDVRLDEVVLRSMERDVERRYQHVSEVKTDVEQITRAAQAPGTRATIPKRAAAQSSTEPCLNPLALWGAILGVFSVLAFAGIIFTGTVVFDHLFTTHYLVANVPPLGVRIAEWVLGAIGALAGLGGTLCGAAAIEQIKKSNGQRYGLPLAAGAVLCFPLLVLGVLTLLGSYIAVNHVLHFFQPPPSADGPPRQVGVGGMYFLPVALLVCFFAARAVWRAIAGHAPPPIPPPGTPHPDPLTGREGEARTQVRGPALVTPVRPPAFAVMGVGLVYLVVAALFATAALVDPIQCGLLQGKWRAVQTQNILQMAAFVALTVLGVLALVGGWRMLTARSYALAVFANIVTLPLGFWGLAVLSRPEVRAAFARAAAAEAASAPARQGSWLGLLSLWTALAALVLPVLLALAGYLLAEKRHLGIGYGYLMICLTLEVGLELAALICGILARATASGKAGLGIAGISLVGCAALLATVISYQQGGGRPAGSQSLGPALESKSSFGPGVESLSSLLKSFSLSDQPISGDLAVRDNAWFADCPAPRTIRLFQLPNPNVDQCVVVYRAKLKTEGLTGKAYLEMWCRLPGSGESFSKGLDKAVTGSTGWASYEIPFLLKKGERPDLISLNVAVEGTGKVWIKDVELLKQPLPEATRP